MRAANTWSNAVCVCVCVCVCMRLCARVRKGWMRGKQAACMWRRHTLLQRGTMTQAARPGGCRCESSSSARCCRPGSQAWIRVCSCGLTAICGPSASPQSACSIKSVKYVSYDRSMKCQPGIPCSNTDPLALPSVPCAALRPPLTSLSTCLYAGKREARARCAFAALRQHAMCKMLVRIGLWRASVMLCREHLLAWRRLASARAGNRAGRCIRPRPAGSPLARVAVRAEPRAPPLS